MEEEMKMLPIKEFREKGYLQELNRRFLHPLGLALVVSIDDDTGEEYIDGVWDCIDDPEGILYGLADSDPDRINKFTQNKNFIDDELTKRLATRTELMSSNIEPIPEIDNG
jgi:hypothetical protein